MTGSETVVSLVPAAKAVVVPQTTIIRKLITLPSAIYPAVTVALPIVIPAQVGEKLVQAAPSPEAVPNWLITGDVRVLLVRVSVVARPTSVSVEVGNVKVPVFVMLDMTGAVKVLLVSVSVLALPTSVSVAAGKVKTLVPEPVSVILAPVTVRVRAVVPPPNPNPSELFANWLFSLLLVAIHIFYQNVTVLMPVMLDMPVIDETDAPAAPNIAIAP